MREIGYHRAESVDQAVELAAHHGEDGLFLAGGQSLVNLLKGRLVPEGRQVIDIGRLDDLSYVEVDEGRIRIGALTTHAVLLESDVLAEHIPAFIDMIAEVGDVQVRNAGTIGGDLAQADPQADYPVLVTALGAELTIRSPDGTRMIAAEDFFTGYFETTLEPADLVVEVAVPIPDDRMATGFSKFAERKGDFPLLNAAAVIERDADGACVGARIRVGCVSGTPVAAKAAEAHLEGTTLDDASAERAGELAAEEIDPDPDEQVSIAYKADLIAAMVERAVDECLDRLED